MKTKLTVESDDVDMIADTFDNRWKTEVRKRARAEEQLRWVEKVDASRIVLHKLLFSPSSSIEGIAHFILDRAKELTGSPHGFVSVINLHTGDHVGYTRTKMLNNEGQVENTNQKFAFPRGSDGYYPGLWGASLNSGKAFYNNAAASHANSSDALARPISWERFLSVPVLMGSQVVGQIALADAEEDYGDRDLNTLQPLARTLSMVIQHSQHETEMEEASQFNQAALDALSVNLAILDDQGTILKVNRAWRNFALANAGDTANLCEGVNYLAIADTAGGPDSEESAGFAAGLRAVLHGEQEEFSLEYPCHSPQEQRWFMARVTRFNSKGNVCLVVTHENITSRKRNEQGLAESEANFRALFDAIGDIFVVASPDGKIIFGNAALERKLGYTPGDLAAMHVLDLNPADKRQEAEDIFAAMFRGERDSCPLPLAAKNKTLLPADTRVWFGKWNGADCLFGISKDLSAEQEAQQRFERLFRHNPTLMAVSSIPERRFTDVNNILLSTLGYSAEEIIGKTSAEIGLFLNPQLQAAAADRLQSNGTFNELELQIRCKDGKILDGLFSGEIIYSQGKECFLTVMLDISERKRMVEGLRRSEQGFATLVKNLPDMIVRFSTSLEIILCNQALEAELGKPVDTFIGKKLLEIGIPVEQSTLLIDSLEQALDTGEEVDVEQSYLTSSGLKHYLARIVPERNSEGKIETLLAIIHDITGRKMIENEQERFNAEMERQVNDRTAQLANAQYRLEDKISELEQAQESLKDLSTKNRIVAENTHDWEFWRDGNGMFIYTSPSCSRITGYEAEEFLRDPRFMEKIIHPHDLSIWQNHTEETAFIKQPGQVEFRILRADGSVCWIDHVCQPVFDDQGRYSGERGSNRDISRSKREQWKKETAIEALSKSEKRLCKLVESVTNYIYTVKVEGGRPLSTSHGDGCESVMGYTPKEFASDPDLWLRVVHPEDSVLVTQQAAKIISGTAVLPIEHRIIRKDGSIRWIKNTHVAQFNKQGKLEGYDGLIVDITERKQAEEDIRNQAARAEVLLHTAASLNTQLDLVTLMNTVCEETASAFKAPSVWIDLYDPKRDTLNFASACNLPPEFKERYQPPSRAMHQLATQLKPMIIIPDVQNVDHANRKLFTSLNIRTVTNMSMMRDGQLIGILNVISYGSVRHFSPNELALLKGISDQAAQSIENARLFKDAQRHLNLQRALHLIDLTITSETQLNASLKIILQLIAGQLNVDSALVLLVDPQSGALDDIASYGLLENMPKLHLEKGENYASRILLNRSPIHIPDLAQAENWVSPALLDLKKGVCYYGTPLIVQDKVIGILEFINTSPFNLDAEWIETLEALATQTAIAIGSVTLLCDLKQSNADLSQAYDTTLEGWSHAMDLRDKETEGHTQRVTAISVRLAGAMGLGEAELLNIRRGALLHDMGKMGIPDSILLKPGPLTDEEWVIMRKHPMYAYEMLSPIGYLRPALDIAYCHHEKWDGSGYPRGLKGDEIPLAARIFAIADVWDALTSDRPYRSAWSPEKTSQHIQEQSGSHFDPQVTAIFVKMLDELLDK